ncbi:MAG TPA: HD domain-containing phosphohydrolase [Burkholderiales bacterium]|nr:HD domain-containing phosphohydrolase [Burkholderiales bacterium]
MSTAKRARILAVDDDSDLLALMAKALGADYDTDTASDAGAAIEKAFASPQPDLILLDVEMPDVSGFEVCRALKGEPATADIPIIFLTGKTEAQAQVEGLELGAVDYVMKPINAKVLKARVRLHLALIDRRQELERLVKERTEQLERTRTELIKRLGRAMQMHESSAVGNRVMRLSHYAKLIAQAAGAKPQVCEMMFVAAPLHDVGKLGIPSEILQKREKLSVPDWERIKRHPKIGADIIGEHDDPLIKLARQIALTHHENWDGSGYPDALKGEAIPWAGRVMAVVDSFEAMTATQYYREPKSWDDAVFEIEKLSGKRYDPKIVEAFKKALPAMQKVRETFADQLGDMINLDFAPKAAAAPAKPAAATPKAAAPKPAAPKKAAVDVAALARAAAAKGKK